MKNVNQLVLDVQTEGKEGMAFVELFQTIMNETIEPKAQSYSRQLKGDIAEAIDAGIDLLTELVDTWNGTGNFNTLFSVSYNNRLKNLVKYLGRNKRKHNTSYDVSLSETTDVGEGASHILEVIDDEQLHTTFDITADEEQALLTDLLEEYEVKKPKTAGLIRIMLSFSDDTKISTKTQAYCDYFGESEYTQAIQKRVSRARESFYKFLVKNNYNLSF